MFVDTCMETSWLASFPRSLEIWQNFTICKLLEQVVASQIISVDFELGNLIYEIHSITCDLMFYLSFLWKMTHCLDAILVSSLVSTGWNFVLELTFFLLQRTEWQSSKWTYSPWAWKTYWFVWLVRVTLKCQIMLTFIVSFMSHPSFLQECC